MWATNSNDIKEYEVPEEYIYTSSDGTKKDIRYMNTEYLINALAKCHREIYNQTTDEDIIKYLTNIFNIQCSLHERIDNFIEERRRYQ